MTRKEQIEKESQEWVLKNGSNGGFISVKVAEEIAFQAGAEWADDFPNFDKDKMMSAIQSL